MAKSVILNDDYGAEVYPITKETLIYDDNGVKLSDKIITYELLFDDSIGADISFMNVLTQCLNRLAKLELGMREVNEQIISVSDEVFMAAVYDIFPLSE